MTATTSAVRERLPNDRRGRTLHIELLTADGQLEVYAIAGAYPDDRPGELFLEVRGANSERYAGFADAFALALSIALQHGVPLGSVTAKLVGSRAEPTGRLVAPSSLEVGNRMSASLVDVLARWLDSVFPAPGKAP